MNQLYINKKVILIIFVIIISLLFVMTFFDQKISEDFHFNKSEKEFISSHQKQTLEITLSEHFIFTDKNITDLETQIKDDLNLDVTIKLIPEGNQTLLKFPSGYYQLGTESSISSVGYILDDFKTITPNVTLIPFGSKELLMKALSENSIDTVLLPYQGDFIYEDALQLNVLSYNMTTPISTNSNEAVWNGVFSKILQKYSKDGTMDGLITQVNFSNHKEFYSDFFNAMVLSSDTKFRVGIENLPPIAYIKNKNIYGLSIILTNNFAELYGLKVEYIIGESDRLLESYNNDELDLLLTLNSYEEALLFYKEPLVIISTHDMVFQDEAKFIYDTINSYPPQQDVFSFEDLISALNNQQYDYYKLPLSTFTLLTEKMKVPDLYLNYETNEHIEYYLLMKEPLKTEFKYLLTAFNEDRILNFAQLSISNEKVERRNWIAFMIIVGIIGFIILIVIIVRLILSINEKQRLNYLFKHDQLTYLPNSYGLKKIFKNMNKKQGALMLVDLRHFKLINDTFGNDIGDKILLELANLFNSIHDSLIVSRTAGDQFTFLMNNESFKDYLPKIMTVFSEYINNDNYARKLDISACYVEFPQFGDAFETLIHYLESTMYHAKANNIVNSWVAYDNAIYQSYVDEQEMAIEIQNALKQEDLLLFYQPQTELYSEKTIGAEVLVRWVHKDRGKIFPDQFLGVAERNGLMYNLDMYMIRKACEQLKIWQDENYAKMKISVNMSTYTFESDNMVDELIKIIEETQIDTAWFAIEITEESGFSNLNYAKQIMDKIKEYGIRFALDDFGKGYSSLSYLEQLPFDFLKIDKAFVDHIHTQEKSKILYYIITDLAKLYNMHIIAEGVEYLDQINIIKKDMKTIIQGYYYSKPLPKIDFEARLGKQSRLSSQ